MATTTGGTTSTTALTTLKFSAGADMADADIATIAQLIKDDLLGFSGAAAPANIVPGAFSRQGLLYVPNRGVLKVLPGDYVMVDPTSFWPILVSAKAIAIGGSVWNS
jgi:hypothetical protein